MRVRDILKLQADPYPMVLTLTSKRSVPITLRNNKEKLDLNHKFSFAINSPNHIRRNAFWEHEPCWNEF
jgi:hypothetical protein